MTPLKCFFWGVTLSILLGASAQGTCQNSTDDALEMLQVNALRPDRFDWKSPRDLAVLPSPQLIRLAKHIFVEVFSAVPTFGPHGNFIALLLSAGATHDTTEYISRNSTFCTGPGRSHRSPIKIHGRAIICEWPANEMDQTTFEVHIEDFLGNVHSKVLASRKPGLLQQYHTVACVRDIYVQNDGVTEDLSDPFKKLVEWLEWHTLHGIEHFFVYTFKGTPIVLQEILSPYLKSGLASRIHFDFHPSGSDIKSSDARLVHTANDCLYRAKNHAVWVLPTLNTDEYFHLTSKPSLLTRPSVDFLKTTWDATIQRLGMQRDKVQSIIFQRYRFAQASANQLDISSTWREASHQLSVHDEEEDPNHVAPGKYACNVGVAWSLHIHHVEAATCLGKIWLSSNDGFINHYRMGQNMTSTNDSKKDKDATIYDDILLQDVPRLTRALHQRFDVGHQPGTPTTATSVSRWLSTLSHLHPKGAM